MNPVRYTRSAESDLASMAFYTQQQWGADQVNLYLATLEAACALLGSKPSLGRPCEDLSTGLRRLEAGRHVIFYRMRDKGILVIRVVHQSMMPRRWRLNAPSSG